MSKEFKVVKVRIRRGNLGENLMVYPKRYNAQEVDHNGIGPLNVMGAAAYSGHIGYGDTEEWGLIILPAKLADEYAKDSDMEVIAPEQADALMEEWRVFRGESEEIVCNPDRIQAIYLKKIAGIELSKSDLQALDPTDPSPGINRRLRPIAEAVTKIGGSFV